MRVVMWTSCLRRWRKSVVSIGNVIIVATPYKATPNWPMALCVLICHQSNQHA